MKESRSRLQRKLDARGFHPQHAAEVGVYRPAVSNIRGYVESGVRSTLVEPDPDSIARIRTAWGERDNVMLHPVAVVDVAGEVQLVKRMASTFLSTLPSSPAIENDGVEPGTGERITVPAVTFDTIDDGTIDLLSIDVEGAEWYALKHLASRPSVISIETHGARYRNPFLREIAGWMRSRGYLLWYMDSSDSVYVQPAAVSVTSSDRAKLALKQSQLIVRRVRKRLAHRIRRLMG